MANTRELRRRIKSIKNISQVTRAMQMVSAVKMRKAQEKAINGRPYSENLSQALERLFPRVDNQTHPLLIGNDSNKIGVIFLSTDKGLVGSLNTNLIRILMGTSNATYITVGRKGRNFVVRTHKDLVADFENVDAISFRLAVQLAKLVTESFITGEVGEVYLIYPHFVSTIKQEATKVKLLPMDVESITAQLHLRGDAKESASAHLGGGSKEFLFEPNLSSLLDSLLHHYIQIRIYQALLETKASEHSARMVAMKNATDNAMELTEDLTLTYNQVRQDSITREILEISSASAAMG